MERVNTIKKLIIAPALIVALTAGSAMAGPRHHFGGAAYRGAANTPGTDVHSELQMLYKDKCKNGCNSDLQEKAILAYSYFVPGQHNNQNDGFGGVSRE